MGIMTTMRWLILLFLSTQTLGSEVTWGSNCSYTAEPQSGTVAVSIYEEKFVTTIPAGKENIYISLSASADLDTKLVAADGTGSGPFA